MYCSATACRCRAYAATVRLLRATCIPTTIRSVKQHTESKVRHLWLRKLSPTHRYMGTSPVGRPSTINAMDGGKHRSLSLPDNTKARKLSLKLFGPPRWKKNRGAPMWGRGLAQHNSLSSRDRTLCPATTDEHPIPSTHSLEQAQIT